ncbi:MAG: hypothetical protein QOE92_2181 [Chloroflexota bacterium]|jgi:hypothetical protein|nr:hypothetical protein [Chloroflexota bacterium]
MTILRVSESGQVYDIDLEELKITPDQGGGFYLHGRKQFLYFDELEEAEEKKQEIEYRGAFG